MNVLKHRLGKLIADAAEFDLIGSLASDDSKRAGFRRLAAQYRQMSEELNDDVISQRDSHAAFLIRQAETCRALAADIADTTVCDELLRFAAELEAKAAEETRE